MSQKLWGGRFTKDRDGRVKSWAESITIDEHMVLEDMWGSMGHVAQLAVQGIITEDVGKKILASLSKRYRGYEATEWRLADDGPFKMHDDVHVQTEALRRPASVPTAAWRTAGRCTRAARGDRVDNDA
jgi:argininosuccinate lyase